ncbi:MAG: Gfo/Idh/MocA family oxidoreductase [Pseudomonadota bacterium]
MSADRIAVLGLGSIGLRHARNALALGLEAVGFDPDPTRRALLEAAGGKAVADRDQALEGAFAAVVATPSELHKSDLERCVNARAHVLVEKPLAHTLDGLQPLLDAARADGVLVAAGFNLRFRAAVVAARALLAAGRLGRPVWGHFISASWLPHWRPHQDYRQGYANNPRTGGVIFDAIHELDLANHLLGPATVAAAHAANTGLLGLESEDIADIGLAHSSGARSTVHLDYVTRPRRRRFEICGTEGLMTVDLRAGVVEIRDHADDVVLREVHDLGFDREYQLELADFVAAARGGFAPACDGGEALAVLAQAVAARRLSGLPE